MKIALASPAKINPNLRIHARRPDGLHEVTTTMLALDCRDEIEVGFHEGTGTLEIELSGEALSPDVPSDERNLAIRGARIALDCARAQGRARVPTVLVHVRKRIPSQAGLGGGSSNAAAAALATARLLGIDASDSIFLERVSALGADVAFFARARTTGWARCTGVGECVTPRDLPRSNRAFVVLTPPIGCSTAAVYAALEPAEWSESSPEEDPDGWAAASLDAGRASLFNGLEAAALRSHPKLLRFRALLDESGGSHFRLAGSGSSFFGLFEDVSDAERFLASGDIRKLESTFGLRAAFVARAWQP